MRILLTLLLATMAVSTPAMAAEPAPLPTVAEVDLARYAGAWYEIALLPNRFQKQCVADTQARYRLDGERVEVINRCRMADGRVDDIKGHAKVVPGSGNARLRVTFFWPFYGDYWVLALDPDFDAMGDQPVGVVGPFGPGGEPATGADVEVRAFVPGIGVPEDPVTGSLAGGLGIWLPTTGVVGDDFVIRQGTALGRRGIVRVTREDGSVWVGGDTVLAVAGDVALGSPGRSSGTR